MRRNMASARKYSTENQPMASSKRKFASAGKSQMFPCTSMAIVQNCSNSIANALELLQSFTKPSTRCDGDVMTVRCTDKTRSILSNILVMCTPSSSVRWRGFHYISSNHLYFAVVTAVLYARSCYTGSCYKVSDVLCRSFAENVIRMLRGHDWNSSQ